MTAISVVIPVRDAAPFIAETMASLRSQTFSDFEVVLIDDGCTDRSIDIARQTFADEGRLRLLSPGAVGLVRALQIGVEAARAPLIARLDADDIAAPNRLELQQAFAMANPDIHLIGSKVRSFPEGEVQEGYRVYESWQNRLLHHDDIVREIYVESPMAHPSVLMRRDDLVAIGGYREVDWPEDYDLWLRAVHAGLRFGKVSEVLLHWREGPRRASRVDPRYSPAAFLRCKAHFLCRGPLGDREEIILWGGPNLGGKLGRLLAAEGIRIAAFVDIDPRRVGGERGGVPVISPEELGAPAGRFMIGAVGVWGARELIRQRATDLGWNEGRDYLFAA